MCVCVFFVFFRCAHLPNNKHTDTQTTARQHHSCMNEMGFRMFDLFCICSHLLKPIYFIGLGFFPNRSRSLSLVFVVFVTVLTTLLHILTATISILNSISFQCRQLLHHFIFHTTKLRAQQNELLFTQFSFFYGAHLFLFFSPFVLCASI